MDERQTLGKYTSVICNTFISQKILNPHANNFVPRNIFILNPNANNFIPKLRKYIAHEIIPNNSHLNAPLNDSSDFISLNTTPCAHDISTPAVSEVDSEENKLLHTYPSTPPNPILYFILYCYLLSAFLLSCICTPIGSSHDTENLGMKDESVLITNNISDMDEDIDPNNILNCEIK